MSFVQIVSVERADGRSPLTELSAFRAFTAQIRDRCEEQPVSIELTEIGSYGVFGEKLPTFAQQPRSSRPAGS